MSKQIGNRTAIAALAALTFVNLFNYLDRYVVSGIAESLRHSELRLSDTQLGLLVTSFMIVYILASPVFGPLGDRFSRPRLIALGVAIWSAATFAAGFAKGFPSLFTARALVGIGEAAYGTIAPALLADYFPPEKRSRVFGIYYAALPIGTAAGYVVGGLIDRMYGWRSAFFFAGAPGVILTIIILMLPDPARGGNEESGARSSRIDWFAYRTLLGNRFYALAVLGYAAYTFGVGALAFWMPAFLERERGLTKAQATVTFGLIVVATGFVGTIAGGWIADALRRRTREGDLWLCGISSLIGAPITVVAFLSHTPVVYITALVAAQLILFASNGPVNAAIVTFVSPAQRATAVALSIFAIHILGDVPSPAIVGAISDRSSLEAAFLILPAAIALSGVIWTYAAVRRGNLSPSPQRGEGGRSPDEGTNGFR